MPRARRMIVVAVVFVLVAAFVVILPTITYIHVPWQGPPGIHDASTLPGEISVCGRRWTLDNRRQAYSIAELQSEYGGGTPFVDPGPFADCPAGACSSVALGACSTVIFARVDEDAYVGYSLQGGP